MATNNYHLILNKRKKMVQFKDNALVVEFATCDKKEAIDLWASMYAELCDLISAASQSENPPNELYYTMMLMRNWMPELTELE